MARPLRIDVEGGWYHITARGNERRAIFRSEGDRQRFLELLGDLPARFGIKVHAFVLMRNHYHLLLETPLGGLSRAMQWLNVSYSVWFNRRHGRSGHLFQGRFTAIVLEAENCAVKVSRYLHLNPVRLARFGLGKQQRAELRASQGSPTNAAEIKERIAALRTYRWSSYRAYVGLEGGPGWLETASIYRLFGGRWRERRGHYRAYVEEAVREGVLESPWERLQARTIIGRAAFVKRVKAALKGNRREQPAVRALQERSGFEEIIREVERLKGERWTAFRDRRGDWGRDLVLTVARRRSGLSLQELGRAAGGLDYSSVSVAVTRFERRLAKDKQLEELLKGSRHQSVKCKCKEVTHTDPQRDVTPYDPQVHQIR